MNGIFSEKDYATIVKASLSLCPPEGAAHLISEGRRLVCLLRHGQTDWNVERRLQGRESVPLNVIGREQSNACGEVFRRAAEAGFKISRVYTSPLGRAMETAEAVARIALLPAAQIEDELNERDYGTLSGLTVEERKNNYKSGVRATGIESVKDTAARMKRVLVAISEGEDDGAVLAVTHGGVINALFVNITSGRIGTGKSISENCSVSLVAVGRDAVIPLAYGLFGDDFLDYAKRYTEKIAQLDAESGVLG